MLNLENLKRAQEKISVEELANELDQLKRLHKKNVEETDKRRVEEFNKFLEGMKTIKNEISEKLVIEQEKNNENIVAISNDFKTLKFELTNRIDNIEMNQKKQMENVKIMLEKGGGKSKNLIKKIITGKTVL
jgi:tRNA A37 N6-isopentenylltransferase MiaA